MPEETYYRKTQWTAIGAGFFCPAAVSLRPGHIALFVRGATGELYHREGNETG